MHQSWADSPTIPDTMILPLNGMVAQVTQDGKKFTVKSYTVADHGKVYDKKVNTFTSQTEALFNAEKLVGLHADIPDPEPTPAKSKKKKKAGKADNSHTLRRIRTLTVLGFTFGLFLAISRNPTVAKWIVIGITAFAGFISTIDICKNGGKTTNTAINFFRVIFQALIKN